MGRREGGREGGGLSEDGREAPMALACECAVTLSGTRGLVIAEHILHAYD